MSVSSQESVVVSAPPVTVTHRNLSCLEVLFTFHHFQVTVLLGHLLDPIKCAAAAAKSLQSCPTLCNPVDGSPPGSPIPGFFQAKTLEWVAISFSNACTWKVKVKSLRRVRRPATPWTTAYQALLSMGFSRQEYWSGVPLPSPSNVLIRTIYKSVF